MILEAWSLFGDAHKVYQIEAGWFPKDRALWGKRGHQKQCETAYSNWREETRWVCVEEIPERDKEEGESQEVVPEKKKELGKKEGAEGKAEAES